jgi:hypothetical protein
MAKPLKTLQRQFLQQGLHLLFSFDTSIAPGVIIERRRARDVNLKGSIAKFKGAKLKVLGPVDLGLMEFSRVHELDMKAGTELIGGGAVGSTVKRARTVNLSLGNPVKFFVDDQIELFSRLTTNPSWPTSAQALTLAERDHFLVTEVVRTKLRFTFHAEGTVALSADATGLKDLKAVNLSGSYKWDNDFELVTKKEVVVAFEAVCWNARRKVFESLRR